jgi:hypothetical protein
MSCAKIFDRFLAACEMTETECYKPLFTGGDDNKFLFHGRRDVHFCLSPTPTCTSTRTSSASAALGIRFGGHRLYLGVWGTATWDAAVDRLERTL